MSLKFVVRESRKSRPEADQWLHDTFMVGWKIMGPAIRDFLIRFPMCRYYEFVAKSRRRIRTRYSSLSAGKKRPILDFNPCLASSSSKIGPDRMVIPSIETAIRGSDP